MLTSKELARTLNTNGGALLDTISIESIQGYLELRKAYDTVNVEEDKEFQEKFISYFKLSGTGVNETFLKRYFEIMEDYKSRERRFDYRLTMRAVFGAQPKKKLTPAQFSYLTRMANVVDDNLPLVDNHLANFVAFDPPNQTKMDSRERMNAYLEFYRELCSVYQDLIDEKMIRDLLMVFKIKLRDYGDYPVSQFKRIDFLVNTASKLHNDGKLI